LLKARIGFRFAPQRDDHIPGTASVYKKTNATKKIKFIKKCYSHWEEEILDADAKFHKLKRQLLFFRNEKV
jgi:hypothetical protein